MKLPIFIQQEIQKVFWNCLSALNKWSFLLMTGENGKAQAYEWKPIVEPGEYIISLRAHNSHNDTTASRFVQIQRKKNKDR